MNKCPFKCNFISSGADRTPICVPDSEDVVCHKEYGLMCPSGCKIGEGEYCYPNSEDFVCDLRNPPLCPANCDWNSARNLCVPTVFGQYCEPIGEISCPDVNFPVINASYPACTMQNVNNPCILDGKVIFPIRLRSTLPNFMCFPKDQLKCEPMQKINLCPWNTQPDSYRNQCKTVPGVIQGAYDFKIPNKNRCEPNYKLANITDGQKLYLRCLPIWYYWPDEL
jgi:hypothetical protein